MSPQHAGAYIPAFYDPMNTESVSYAICRELERQPKVRFPPHTPPFDGSGLYAIYYTGESLELYKPLASFDIPVYVGKSNSHNSSTGKRTGSRQRLWKRVSDHHESISGAGLPAEEFRIRLLLLPDVHNSLGEHGLITNYQPVWNSYLTGFGSREQGASTRKSRRSKWDTVHRGRARTFGEDNLNRELLEEEVRRLVYRQIESYDNAPWR